MLAVFIYGVSMIYSVFLWRKGFRRDDRVNYLLLLLAFGFHAVALFKRGFSLERCPVHNLFEATMLFTWMTTLIYLVMGVMQRFRFLGAFLAPVLFPVGVFALMPALDAATGPILEMKSALLSMHAATIMLGYGAFALAAGAAAMLLTQQHNLKFNKLRAVLSLLPPVERLDRVASGVVLVGFVLLTIGLAAGGRLPRPEGVTYWRDAKVLWSALLWGVYLLLLLGHRLGWLTGRWFAIGLISAFVFLLLTFWGTNLLSELHQK